MPLQYMTVRDLIEALQHLDPDARVELEVQHTATHDPANGARAQAEQWTDSEPLLDLRQRCADRRYVTLRGEA